MTNTIPNVPRELLAELQEHIHCHHDAVLWGKVCDLLSAPSPAGVDGLDVVGWYTEDHLDDKSATTYSREVADRWLAKGWPVNGIANAAAAQAIIDGLRGELAVALKVPSVAAMHTYLDTECAKDNMRLGTERDQHAQRIGELEGLLRESGKTIHKLQAEQPTPARIARYLDAMRGQIDAALSAGKEGE